jgi:antitoxin component YwqK of YwqJK toxin-antitoxin module
MQNDTINGDFWHTSKNGYPYSKGHFNKGVPHGEFIRYFNSYDKYLDTGKYFREKYTFDRGYLSGRYLNYRDTDNIRYTIDFDKNDSMYFTAFSPIPKLSEFQNRHNKQRYEYDAYYRNGHSRSSYSESNMDGNTVFNGSEFANQLFGNPYLKRGLYTYYYKSGFVFKQGYKINHELSGRWTFFREGKNRIYKTIDFKDSFLYAEGEDSVFSKGYVKAYYDDGKLMFIGYATDNNTKYTCESETDIPTEEDYYLAFYDTLGQNILKDGNGFITELQASGQKLKEGQMLNYKKNGIWVYYNNYGQAEGIGMYENGLKVGRWLFGDLSGLNLSDKVCFMNNDEYMDWINTYGGNLDLTESFYTKGKFLNGNSVDTIKR